MTGPVETKKGPQLAILLRSGERGNNNSFKFRYQSMLCISIQLQVT